MKEPLVGLLGQVESDKEQNFHTVSSMHTESKIIFYFKSCLVFRFLSYLIQYENLKFLCVWGFEIEI